MKLSRSFRDLTEQVEETLGARSRQRVLRTVGLATAGVTMVALGVLVGRELRGRYKFNRRTPYDLYAHAGDSIADDCGVGI